ncbi:MAG: class I SAM-dependent methyltransferase [Planctomycetota bacterium]|nr:class I SAM-dependent methyltransferase [Planctomycetota bacterium]
MFLNRVGMGLPRAAISLLLHEAHRRSFSGTIATLGRQHVYATEDEIRQLAARHDVQLSDAQVTMHREPSLRERRFISDDSLYQLLGFQQSIRIDCSEYEAPDELLDLNQSETPSHLVEAFDVILDSGTIEHIFDVPAALRHCSRMLRPGGRVIHITPTANCVDHGFYSISPTLYADYYKASRFQIDRLYVCRLPNRFERRSWQAYDYLQAGRESLPFGRLDRRAWFTYAVATRTKDSLLAVPQQSFYLTTWGEWDTASKLADGEAMLAEPPHTKAARLLRTVEFSRTLTTLARSAIRCWRWLVNRFRACGEKHVPWPYAGRF